MYAIVKTGGKQYKVTEGLVFETELLNAEVDSTVELEVVLASDDTNVVKVLATVVEHGKGKKLHIFTYKAKKNIRKRQGHRQPYTKLKVNTISIG